MVSVKNLISRNLPVLGVSLSLVLCLVAGTSDGASDGSFEIIGDNLVWEYRHSPEEVFYMSNHTATDEFFPFSVRNESESVDGFSLETEGRYLTVTASTKRLSLTDLDERGVFRQIASSEGGFNLEFEGELLVAYPSSPPFEFYLQSRYPSEPPAEFRLSQDLNVTRAYAGKLSYAEKVAKFIHSSPSMDKSAAYATLVDLMELNSHFQGMAVFTIAGIIFQDFGASDTWAKFPLQVRYITSGENVRLFFNDYGESIPIPMKYVSASKLHLNIQPYQFEFNATNFLFSITYAQVHQLKINKNCFYLDEDLYESVSPTKSFQFAPSLYTTSDPVRIGINSYGVLGQGCDKSVYSEITEDSEESSGDEQLFQAVSSSTFGPATFFVEIF